MGCCYSMKRIRNIWIDDALELAGEHYETWGQYVIETMSRDEVLASITVETDDGTTCRDLNEWALQRQATADGIEEPMKNLSKEMM
jgi:hypothetical protein